jgi:hypothetical protein
MPPAAFPQGQPGFYPQQGYPPPGYAPVGFQPPVPSRTLTVVITAFFGLFGIIPAVLHSKRAEAVGVPGSRYWKAFGITLGVVVAVHALIWTLLFVLVFNVATTAAAGLSPVTPTDPAQTSSAPDPQQTTPAPPPPADNGAADIVWSAALLQPVLEAYADEETEDWGAFSSDSTVIIPCGGEGAHGISPDTTETTAGGVDYGASAQILTDTGAASAEMDRLSGLVAGCGPHDYISASDGSVLARCDAPIVGNLGSVIRYEQVCDLAPGDAWAYAIFQTGNAVVAINAPTAGELDAILPVILGSLQAG